MFPTKISLIIIMPAYIIEINKRRDMNFYFKEEI